MSGCIIQFQGRLGQQEDGHSITDKQSWENKQKKKKGCVLQRCKQTKTTTAFFFFSGGETLCNRLKLGVNPQSRATISRWSGEGGGDRPLQGRAEVVLNRSCYSSHIRFQHFIFIAVMFNQLPWELGHPHPPPFSPSPSSSFTPSLHHFSPHTHTQRGLPWDVNHAVN